LLSLLEDLPRPYPGITTHPPHILLSELYILALTAECCSEHWKQENAANGCQNGVAQPHTPGPLEDVVVTRTFDVLKGLMEPIPDGYILPAQTILDDTVTRNISVLHHGDSEAALPIPEGSQANGLLEASALDMEVHVKTIVEYVTASNWPCSFDYFRNVIYSVRTSMVAQASPSQPVLMNNEGRGALVILRLMSFFWLDSQKLGLIIQELCSSFLHFHKPFQNTVAIVTPLLITRWLDRFPEDFVNLHTLHKRLDGGADTLFDMAQTVIDNGRRKAILYPLQTTLLFLLPDVFEVASNLREAKSSGMAKKVAFLDGLRKALRNRNEPAGYCLVSLLRVARHFNANSDAALVSYALDVQDEVREAVFRRFPATVDAPMFEQDIMTAAFVSLAHLKLDNCVATLDDAWLAPSAPPGFKVAVVQGCCYFAKQSNRDEYQSLFTAAAAYMQGQLKVFFLSPFD
jgi:neurofibromin 1